MITIRQCENMSLIINAIRGQLRPIYAFYAYMTWSLGLIGSNDDLASNLLLALPCKLSLFLFSELLVNLRAFAWLIAVHACWEGGVLLQSLRLKAVVFIVTLLQRRVSVRVQSESFIIRQTFSSAASLLAMLRSSLESSWLCAFSLPSW